MGGDPQELRSRRGGQVSRPVPTRAEASRSLAALAVTDHQSPGELRARDRRLPLGQRTYVMAILNLTDDSFSGDGVGSNVDQAIRRAVEAEQQGADIIDIGGESARADVPVRDAAEESAVVGEVVRR